MTNLNFRNAGIADLERIVAIYNSTIASGMVTADTEPVTIGSRKEWLAVHNPAKRPLWVIENETGAIIGWVSFQSFYGRPAYDATAEISIYLAAAERGKGLGQQILRYCLKKAPALDIKTLLGFIFAHNEPSLRLFRKLGFEDWANLPAIAMIQGKEYDLKILGKRVA